MKLLVKKSVYDELVKPKLYISFNYGSIEKSFNSSLHPRIDKNINAKDVYVYLQKEDKFLKIK